MRSLALALALVFATTALAPTAADARRIGGGGAVGMQRSLPPRTPEALPAKPAAPVAQQAAPPTAATTPAVAPRRSWLGPIAGLAAGLGIAALMSHFGFGAEFGSLITLILLGLVAVVAVRFVMRRFAPASTGSAMQYAGAGASASTSPMAFGSASTGAATGAAFAPPASTPQLPAGFDAAGFERIAKMIFIRLQAANDAGDIDDLRAFTTPEMFAVIKLDLQDRGGAGQRTDVVRIDAEVLDVATQADRQVVSVRFHGLIREEADTAAVPFDEVWHLVKPADGSREWAIAGIQQSAAAVAGA
ncbi:MAG TPA: Tim44-like domain-containing protein [Caldimonas sp.]|jgi:predicted lipid-binding transport protein (Tim44 family)|nr:Tim44-like domain-containing protein [Caldimonas sp.]HEX4235457.1 Tim44-like domain-containing protein [Caldimonas sp.]